MKTNIEQRIKVFRKNILKKRGSLAKNNPELAKQWHPTLNGNLTPHDVTKGTEIKVWWQCPKGHEYQARIEDRTKGNKCSKCCQEAR